MSSSAVDHTDSASLCLQYPPTERHQLPADYEDSPIHLQKVTESLPEKAQDMAEEQVVPSTCD